MSPRTMPLRPNRRARRAGAAIAVLAVLVTACLPNYPDPPAVATGVVGSTPAPGGRMVPTTTPIVIRFSDPVATATVAVAPTPSVALGSPQWILGGRAVVFTPASALPPSTSFSLSITGTDAKGGAIIASPVTFTTAPTSAVLPAAHPRLLLTGATRTRLASSLAAGDAAAMRFKDVIDDHLFNGATLISDYGVWWGGMLGQLTGNAAYCTDSVQRIDQWVATAEAEIAAGRNPAVAGDSYLHVGDQLGDLALIWDWCASFRTAAMTTRWSAFAQQTVFNVWNHQSASWGGRPAPWTGWGTDNPRNNYYLSFLQATLLWGAAATGEHPGAAGWLAQARQKIERDLTIIHTTETPGGGSLEGTGYGGAIKRLFFLHFIWEASTGQRWTDLTSSSQAWIRYAIASVVPTNDRFAPIGDQSRIVDALFTDYQREALLALAELHRGSPWGRRARASASTFLPQMERPEQWVFDFLYGVPDPGSTAVQPLTYHAPGTDHVFTRSGTGTDATWLGFVSGPYVESHAHHDALSLLLYRNGWQVDDGGLHSNSGLILAEEAHALVMLEAAGTPLRMDEGGSAQLYASRSATDYTHLAGSIGSLYPGHAVAQDREIVFLPAGAVVVFDRIDSLGEPLTRTFQLPTPTPATISPDTRVVRTGSGSSGIAVHRVHPDVATVATQPLTSLAGQLPGMQSDFTGGYRTTTSVSGDGKTEFLHVVSLGDRVASVERVSPGGGRGVRIHFTDGTTTTVNFSINQRRGTLLIQAADQTVTRRIDLLPGVER